MGRKAWIRRNQVAVYALAVLAAVGVALDRPATGAAVEQFIEPVLVVLLYVTFLEVLFVRIRRAFTDGRFMTAALGTNFLVVPAVAWVLTRALLSNPAVLVGAFVVLLTPCIDYVITFTELADGDAAFRRRPRRLIVFALTGYR